MIENPDFEQNHFSRTVKSIYRSVHDSFRIRNLLAYYDRSCYENKNYFDLMISI